MYRHFKGGREIFARRLRDLKYLGAALIFLSAFFGGILAGRREQMREKQCEAFLALFCHVKNQVEYFLMPTKLIYGGFENETLEKIGFLPALRAHESDEVYCDVWQEAFKSCEDGIELSPRQKDIVLDFGSHIGKSDGNIQTDNFDYYIKQMSDELETVKKETAKNIRVYRTLGFTAGAAAAILII